MAVQIQFDSLHNPIQPTIVLTTKSGRKLGKISVQNLVVKGMLSDGFDMSFKVYQSECPTLWDQIVDFKCVWAKEWNQTFEISVEASDDGSVVKSVTAVSLGKAELSQIKLYEKEINTEDDISRDDYVPTVFYREDDSSASLLHRIIEKAPHYRIGHVDTSLKNIQRTFSFNDKTIQDAFKEVSEEIGCLITVDCGYDRYNQFTRTINAYDLKAVCLECGTRGDFDSKCSKCESTDVKPGYGSDTNIFVSTENLAENINLSVNTGAVKNCFKLEAGDDLMTAAVVGCNPNGSAYLWNISDAMKADMSEELVGLLDEYDRKYAFYQKEYVAQVDQTLRDAYNNLIEKYSAFSTDYKKIAETITGYPALMEAYFDAIDFGMYLTSGLMPSPEMAETSAADQLRKIKEVLLTPVSVKNIANVSAATAESAVTGMMKAVIDGRYKISVSESAFSDNVWSGIIVITNYADADDTVTSERLSCEVNGNYEGYVKQKILKTISKSVDDSVSIENMFSLSETAFSDEMKKYCLSRLSDFQSICQTCIDILIEHGLSDSTKYEYKDEDLYNKIYLPYYNKLQIIEREILLREDEIAVVSGKFDKDGKLVADGLQTFIQSQTDAIHEELNFERFIGEEHMLELAAYRREDTYTNSNYISDGLNNAELFRMAQAFIDVAKAEIFKSSTNQHTISAKLRNLLAMKEFALIVDKFELGNWIRVRIDGQIFRLRLIEYEIDFDNFENIDVDFSDLIVLEDAVSDIESVIGQAASMASSYDYVARQASKGETGNTQLTDWVERGLDLTKMRIVDSADNQNVTWDSHGLLCKEYLPIDGKYDDKQLKIINRGLYLTDDGWKSSKAGIGDFTYWNPKTGRMEESYGVIADVIVGNIILSEEVGIYNQNNSVTMDQNGLVITATPNETEDPKTLLMVRRQTEQDGVQQYEKLLYLDDNGYLVLNGSVRFQSQGTSESFEDVSQKIDDVVDRIDGFNGLFFYIRYSASADGSNMTEVPNETTEYLGTCNTDEKTAPTDPSAYTWVKCNGTDGINTAIIYLYKRDSAVPNLVPHDLVYTFASGELSGDLNGWTQTVPVSNGYPCYMIQAIAASNQESDSIPATEWSEPVKFVEDGDDGSNGNNTAIVYLYRRSATALSVDWSESLTYSFTNKSLTSVPTGWSKTIPDGTDPLYVTAATATSATETDTIAYTEWSTPVVLAKNGADGSNGTDGLNSATVFLYKRAASAPSKPTKSVTYTFATGAISDADGWSVGVPSGTDPCYVIQATAVSRSASDTISSTEWADPVILAQNGDDGSNGNNTAIVYLYRRSATALSVDWSESLTYRFSTKLLDSVPSGWLQSIPSGTDPIYVTMATAYGNTDSDTIDSNQWCEPVILAENGKDGIPGAAGADGRTQYLHIKYSDDGETFTGNDGEDVGNYIGTLVDFNQTDSTVFSDYKWKEFSGDISADLEEIQRRIDESADNIYDTLNQKEEGIYSKIDAETSAIRSSMTDQINVIQQTIQTNYESVMSEANAILNSYKAEIGQYMEFGDNGLILGASSSSFKTVIDNTGMYFKEGDAIVSYVRNNQLHIPNAVIESTLALGNFFFSPRSDGGVSLVWQEGG